MTRDEQNIGALIPVRLASLSLLQLYLDLLDVRISPLLSHDGICADELRHLLARCVERLRPPHRP